MSLSSSHNENNALVTFEASGINYTNKWGLQASGEWKKNKHICKTYPAKWGFAEKRTCVGLVLLKAVYVAIWKSTITETRCRQHTFRLFRWTNSSYCVHTHTHTHTLSLSHCCCWRNLLTWPQHHLHFPCYDQVAPGQNRCHGEEAESPWKHQRTAKDIVGLEYLKVEGGEGGEGERH